MPNNPPTQLKSDTARANGAKSRGPKSAATREKSSRNSLRHGLTAYSTVVLACESQSDFEALQADYYVTHQPATPEETGLVREMIAARWRIQRLWTAETALIDLEMIRQQPEVEKEFSFADPGIVFALAIRSLTDNSRSLSLISCYESRLQRVHERSRKSLGLLQEQRKAAAAEQPVNPAQPIRPSSPAGAAAHSDPIVAAPTQPVAENPAAARCLRNRKTHKRTQAGTRSRRFGRPNRSILDVMRTVLSQRRGAGSARPTAHRA